MNRKMQMTTTKARHSLLSFIAVIFLTPTLSATHAAAHPGTPIEQGFNDMYNLDFSTAHHQFDIWEAAHPDDPMGPVCHAAALLFTEFDRLGVLESQLFTNNDRFADRRKLSPDPQTKRQFMAALDMADALADKALRRNSQDANAEFTKILSFGLRSDYAALVEKRDLVVFRYTR